MLYKKLPLHIFFGDKKTAEDRKQLQLIHSNLPHIAALARVHNLRHIIRLDQTHSTIGYAVTENTLESFTQTCFSGDFLMTNLKQIGLLIYTADCLPIIFFDPIKQVIALAHAGWRGSVEHIAQRTAEKLQKQYACLPENIHIFFGPSAHVCCYQVSADFSKHLITDQVQADIFTQRNAKYYFNNQLYNQTLLRHIGIQHFNNDYAQCTICETNFCSYRRDPDLQERQFTLVWLS
jgi:polyphenol oxidase